jgi:hypothetical protein
MRLFSLHSGTATSYRKYRRSTASLWLRSRPLSSPPRLPLRRHALATSYAALCPAPCPHPPRMCRRGRGGLRLHPHPGTRRQEGETCAPRVYASWTVALDIPLTWACWLPSSTLGRLWPPVTLCFKCFMRFRLMSQVFRLDVVKVDLGCFICCNDNIHMFQAYVQRISVVSACFKCFHLDIVYVCYDYTCIFQVFVFMCFRCFRLILQKWIWILYMLLWLYTHVWRAYFKCFICFSFMLQMFYL